MAHKENINDRDKIMALRLAAEAETSKARLLAEGPGVVSMRDIEERIAKIENYQLQAELRQHIQIAR